MFFRLPLSRRFITIRFRTAFFIANHLFPVSFAVRLQPGSRIDFCGGGIIEKDKIVVPN